MKVPFTIHVLLQTSPHGTMDDDFNNIKNEMGRDFQCDNFPQETNFYRRNK